MRNNIDGAKQIIYKHTEAKDLSMHEKNLKLEYKFFEKYIDREENHKKYSFPYNKEYDRYKDIKPYYFNFIGNNVNIYINIEQEENKKFSDSNIIYPESKI